MKESGGKGEDGDIGGSGLEEDSSSGSDSEDGEGADKEGERNDDEEERKDWGGNGDNDTTVISERAVFAIAVTAR